MSFIGLHAIARRMDDQRPTAARLAHELVHPRCHLLDTTHRIQAVMGVPHIADHDRSLGDRPAFGLRQRVEPAARLRDRDAVAQRQGHLRRRRVLCRDGGPRHQRQNDRKSEQDGEPAEHRSDTGACTSGTHGKGPQFVMVVVGNIGIECTRHAEQ